MNLASVEELPIRLTLGAKIRAAAIWGVVHDRQRSANSPSDLLSLAAEHGAANGLILRARAPRFERTSTGVDVTFEYDLACAAPFNDVALSEYVLFEAAWRTAAILVADPELVIDGYPLITLSLPEFVSPTTVILDTNRGPLGHAIVARVGATIHNVTC